MNARSRLLLDIGLFLAFLAAFSPTVTGISVHEWLSLALAVPTLAHLILNWDWVLRTIARFVNRARTMSRVNLGVDIALFLATVTVMLSGFMVSQVIASTLGLALSVTAAWSTLHALSATATIGLLLVHLGLHVPWAVRVTQSWLAE